MANNLSTEKRSWLLKKYFKTKNAAAVRRNWIAKFNTPAPSNPTIIRIRDKANDFGSVADVPESVFIEERRFDNKERSWVLNEYLN